MDNAITTPESAKHPLKPSIVSIAHAIAAFKAGGFEADAIAFREWAELLYDDYDHERAFSEHSEPVKLGSKKEWYQEGIAYLKKTAFDLRDQSGAGESDFLRLFREEIKGMKRRLEEVQKKGSLEWEDVVKDAEAWTELEKKLDEMEGLLKRIEEEDPIYLEAQRERAREA